ncbi:LamG domain-containing protein [Pontibacter silvestris]|uniref:LamG domain-containing protein n=1 Tax=Pontibacter silvestris TaxID=2305183 RepID=A0ABW4WSH8_9BACT|nr:LamG domain-containing protein [Pontibacter silvestris]MCC9137753.1 LamG domain-containing protein [Pontibacter silvestris]
MRTRTYFCLLISAILYILNNNIHAQGSGNAFKMDGLNDYVGFDNNNRGIENEVTVEAWIKTNSFGHHHILSKYDRDAERGFQLLIQNGKACLAGRDGSGSYRLSGYSATIVADNSWHHIAGVVHEGTWTIYVDGKLQNQFISRYENTILRSNEELLIGNYYYSQLGNHFYNGQVDEVRIWKRALSIEEIRQNMCQSVPVASTDLVAYFKFDETSGSTVKDYSNLSIDGVLRNTTIATAKVTSGAPIGDKSIYLYPSSWAGQQLEIKDEYNNSFKVDSVGIGSPMVGIHLYHVRSRPNSLAGLNNAVDSYYGVFTAISPATAYKTNYAVEDNICSASFFSRADNSVLFWNPLATTVQEGKATAKTDGNSKEYVVATAPVGKVNIQGPNYFCAGSTIELSVISDATPIWSTGETGNKITVSRGGKYWVSIQDGNCLLTDTVQVQAFPKPALSLGDDITICDGETVELGAPPGLNNYVWSTGATTSSIKATTVANIG